MQRRAEFDLRDEVRAQVDLPMMEQSSALVLLGIETHLDFKVKQVPMPPSRTNLPQNLSFLTTAFRSYGVM
jgi:hypothetical protein